MTRQNNEEDFVGTVISNDGTRIAFDQLGEGPALIIVNGALSRRTDAASVSAKLAPHFTVLAYDRRGRGDSGDTVPYAVEREVEDIAALIAEAGGSAFVFGHSSGAILALEAARQLPRQITKLALYEPPLIVDDSRPPLPADGMDRLKEMLASERRSDALIYWMTDIIGVPAEMVAPMRDSPMWPALEATAPTMIYDLTITTNGLTSLRGAWNSVTVPTLVMDGGASPEWMHNAAQAVADALPNAQRRTLAGQTHGPADEILVPALVEFFAN